MNVLEVETGVHPGFINNGGLFIANSKERLDEYKRLMTIRVLHALAFFHVMLHQYPYHIVLNHYFFEPPGDGTVDPAGFCTALARAATAKGAKVLEKCPVVGVETQVDDFGTRRVAGVQTAAGTVRTKALVNCTGAWAPYIGAMVGVPVPLVAMKHAYVVTNRIEGIQNMPNVRDHDLSLYLRLQGDALSVGGYEPNPVFVDKLPKDFAFGLYDLDWDVFGMHIESGIHRVPVLEQTGIKSTVCGPESFTADHKPLLGEEPSLRGFFHGCGFNSLGMNGGGGCGRELAAWVLQGRPNLDMYGYDIRHDTSLRTDWEECFSQPMQGSTTYTCMLNSRGMVEADLTVSAINPGEGSACDPKFRGASANHGLAHIRSVVQDEKFNVSITDESEAMGMISIQGPKRLHLCYTIDLLSSSDSRSTSKEGGLRKWHRCRCCSLAATAWGPPPTLDRSRRAKENHVDPLLAFMELKSVQEER
ncbi:hypothetical protein HPB48_005184 [Haemaphysalis longicornis]|uniref:FAD dependent oxidoreductase domain-containing protein n=1 Tax=Haemaphysalis longicornis TaxID=44386 RepID=A0A9J6FG43_HAELO|nr:hypothetical protein HPB48_005184 [Haemaphysalis longicornis]